MNTSVAIKPGLKLPTVTDSNTETMVEIAARKARQTVFSSPVDQIKKGFHSVVTQGYATFNFIIVASLLSDALVDKLETTDVAGLLQFDISALAELTPTERLRENYVLKPGDGANKPITMAFVQQLYNIPAPIVASIMEVLPAKARSANGIPMGDFVSAVRSMNPRQEYGEAMENNYDAFNEKFVSKMTDMANFRMAVKQTVFNEDTDSANLEFHFFINVNPIIYKEIVVSDEFSPYLLNLWIYNSLTNSARRGVTIIDPRNVSIHRKNMEKLQHVAPKVNERGFALYGNGAPIYIPPELDNVNVFMKKANSCIDEDGNFDKQAMIEEHHLNNQIIYVDWINDIMAYTSNTGRIETIDLGNVTKLDLATEYAFLSTPMNSRALKDYMNTIYKSMNNLDAAEAAQYSDDAGTKTYLQNNSANHIHNYLALTVPSNEEVPTIKLRHLAGHGYQEFMDYPEVVTALKAFKALIRLLIEKVKADPDALEIESKYKSLGIKFRLVGLEYMLQTIGNLKADVVDAARNASAQEDMKRTTDLTLRTFEIPNLKIGNGGLNGVQPHQGRIHSMLQKTPSNAILPISTGGGKTIQLTIDALMGIVNTGAIPIISTKGSLVRGMITEINAICGGKVNAIPLRPVVIRKMKRQTSVKTWADFIKWFRSLPPNTILVNSYTDYASKRKLFDELDTMSGFGDAPIYTNQYLLIIKMLGLQMFIGDESHMMKNPESARSRNSYAAFSQGHTRHIASGTFLANTVKDAVGQARAVTSFTFGDDPDHFAEMYGVTTGLIKTDEEAALIKNRLKATVAYQEASEEDWAYMLPQKEDLIVFANMTAMQKVFYDKLMLEAMILIQEEEKKKGKASRLGTNSDEDDDDDEDEDDDEDDDSDDDEKEENRFISKAKVYLQRVEAFLVAPDEDPDYPNWIPVDNDGNSVLGGKPPQGDDLISPKVRLADKYLEDHYAKHKDNMSHNKVMVFGYNRVASRHFMKYSRFAKIAMHYTAGDEEVTRKFEKDPNATLIVGDETSIREGNNWQMASLILRLQSVWTPGEHKQTVARMYRPDPRGIYNRERIHHIWIMAATGDRTASLDQVKMARLSSKYISLARFTYEGRHEWKMVSNNFDGMEMLKMNMELIFRSKIENISEYFDAWKVFVNWENQLNKNAKAKFARQLEQRFDVDLVDDNGKIRDINEFIKYAMSEVTSETTIKGSKRVWVPFVGNAIPADPDNWGFATIGQQALLPGTVVYSSWGPVIVTKVSLKSAKVQLYNGKTIGVNRNTLFAVNPKKYKSFVELVKNPSKWKANAFDVGGVKAGKLSKEQVVDDEEEIDLNDDEPVVDKGKKPKLIQLDPVATIINGWPALLITKDVSALKKIKGWNRVDSFVSVGFTNWKTASKFLEVLDGKVDIADDVYDALLEEMGELKQGSAMILGKQLDKKTFRNFFLDQRKKLGKTKQGAYRVHPYWIAVESEIRLAFDRDSHDMAFITWLKRQKASGIKNIRENDALWINTFTSVSEAYSDLDNLNSIGNVDKAEIKSALVEIKQMIIALKKPRRRPTL